MFETSYFLIKLIEIDAIFTSMDAIKMYGYQCFHVHFGIKT